MRFTPRGGLDVQSDYLDPGVWHNSNTYYDSRGPQHQAGVTASGFFNAGNLSHELKFGFGYKHTRVDSVSVWPGDQLVGFEHFQLASVTRASNPKYQMNYYDAYVGDTIQTGRLTVNVGLRFDYQQGKNLPSAVSPNPAFPERLPPVQYGGDSGYPITWRMLQPRVGATYALGRDKTTLLRASYAKFSNQLGSEVRGLNAFPGVAYLYYDWTDTDGNRRVEPGEVDSPVSWAGATSTRMTPARACPSTRSPPASNLRRPTSSSSAWSDRSSPTSLRRSPTRTVRPGISNFHGIHPAPSPSWA